MLNILLIASSSTISVKGFIWPTILPLLAKNIRIDVILKIY